MDVLNIFWIVCLSTAVYGPRDRTKDPKKDLSNPCLQNIYGDFGWIIGHRYQSLTWIPLRAFELYLLKEMKSVGTSNHEDFCDSQSKVRRQDCKKALVKELNIDVNVVPFNTLANIQYALYYLRMKDFPMRGRRSEETYLQKYYRHIKSNLMFYENTLKKPSKFCDHLSETNYGPPYEKPIDRTTQIPPPEALEGQSSSNKRQKVGSPSSPYGQSISNKRRNIGSPSSPYGSVTIDVGTRNDHDVTSSPVKLAEGTSSNTGRAVYGPGNFAFDMDLYVNDFGHAGPGSVVYEVDKILDNYATPSHSPTPSPRR